MDADDWDVVDDAPEARDDYVVVPDKYDPVEWKSSDAMWPTVMDACDRIARKAYDHDWRSTENAEPWWIHPDLQRAFPGGVVVYRIKTPQRVYRD